ncbi:MAG TPA: DUF4832 domain-containing protein [Polyangiaceae bacterium]|nr:DUF4832 domain-containing protein [Polyangiaceae bacterium]
MHSRVIGPIRVAALLAWMAAGCSQGASNAPALPDVNPPTAPAQESDSNPEEMPVSNLQNEERDYELDTNPDLPNPERGVAFWFETAATDPHTLEYHFLWLGEVCDQPLIWNGLDGVGTSAVLKDWATAAIELRKKGVKVIFRPRYDSPGREGLPNGCQKLEGASYGRMLEHVDAIAKMLGDPQIKPSLAFIEMGYLGSWGEWNTGDNCDVSKVATCQRLAPVLLANEPVQDRIHLIQYVVEAYRKAGVTRSVAVRRPEYHRNAVENMKLPKTSLGFHNDCLMVDENDGGNFIALRWDYADYHELYPDTAFNSVTEAKAYLAAQVGTGSMGGETCPNASKTEPWRNANAVRERLQTDQFQYLHAAFAPEFRAAMIAGLAWDDVKSRLGYRYHAKSVRYPSSVRAGAPLTVSVDLENSGFARIPQERTAYLVLEGAAQAGGGVAAYVVGKSNPGSSFTPLLAIAQAGENVGLWRPGETITFSQTFPAPGVAGSYRLKLYIPDPECIDNRFCGPAQDRLLAVRLATKRAGNSVFDPNAGTNDLDVSITVSPP